MPFHGGILNIKHNLINHYFQGSFKKYHSQILIQLRATNFSLNFVENPCYLSIGRLLLYF